MSTSSHIWAYCEDQTLDAQELARFAGRAGIEAVHLHWEALHRILQKSNLNGLAWDEGFALEGSLPVGGIEVTPLTAERDDELDRQTDDIYMQMQVARRLGMSAVSVHGGARSAVAFEYFTAGLTRLALLAERLGLDICLCNRCDTALEQPLDLHRVFAEVQADNLKVDLDAAEFHRSSVNPCEAVWAFQQRVRKARLSDVAAGRHVALGEGEINAAAVADALREVHFAGPILLKFSSDSDASERFDADRRFVRTAGLAL